MLCATSGRLAAQTPTTTVPPDDGASSTTTSTSAPTTTAPTGTSTTSTAPTTAAPPTTAALRPTPGVYVEETDANDAIVGAPTGVPVLIGVATPTSGVRGGGTLIASTSEFDAAFDDPSPAMDAAVSSFFAAGGDQAMVVPVAAEDPATLSQALMIAADVDGWDLLVVPALAGFGGADWMSLATDMARTAAEQRAVALLDPPTDAVAAAATDAGAQLVATAAQLRETSWPAAAVLYSSPLLTSDGSTSSAAAAGAGVLAAGDRDAGPWSTPGGAAHPIPGLTPTLVLDNPLSTTLAPAGITLVRTLPGYGTVLMGDRTVSDGEDERELSMVRTLDMIERSIQAGLEPYVFAPNDATTWSQVTAAVGAYLESLWAQGGLVGAEPSDAYTVSAGVGSTMTAQDLLDGYMIVAVSVQLGDPARLIELSLTQTMPA